MRGANFAHIPGNFGGQEMATMTDPIPERMARLEGAYEHLATKADLAHLATHMAQMETRMAQMETRMTWRLIGAMVGMSGIIITSVALIVRFL